MTPKAIVSSLRIFDLSNPLTYDIVCMTALVIEFLLYGLVFSYGWNKFLVPVFDVTISLPQAIAIIVAGKALTIGAMSETGSFIDMKLTRITHLICTFVFLYIVQF